MIRRPLTIFKTGNVLVDTLYGIERHYNGKIKPVLKRAEILTNLIKDKDKTKHWHTQITNPNPSSKKRNVFEKIYRPNKRENVLNSVFIKSITDVISTGDVAPDILGKGIEITGVKISPCFRILNVYWQIPPCKFDEAGNIDEMLNSRSFEIRSELISRNVVGRVPKIFFIRDYTNAKIAAFEEAMKEIDSGSSESSVMPDDSFVDDIYSFKTKEVPQKFKVEVKDETLNQSENLIPPRPLDMKSDVFGLDHDTLMNKVMARKKKCSVVKSSAVISPETMESEDLFCKIPGEAFQGVDDGREKILKEFHLQRKLLMKKNNLKKDTNLHNIMIDHPYDEYDSEEDTVAEDFVEE